MGLIRDWLLCLVGRHSWSESIVHRWGEDVKIRQCVRCGKQQRWWASRSEQTFKMGRWVDI